MAHHRHRVHEKHKDEKEKRARGGKADFYAGGESNVAKEAEEKKRGGKVHMKKRGGKEMGHMEGHHAKKRMDRPGRKRGGGVGADMKPLSSASKTASAQEGHKTEKEPDVEGG